LLREAIEKALWSNVEDLYLSKSLVNNIFLWKKIYNSRIKFRGSLKEHMNEFNIVVSQLLSIDINIYDEYKCINLLCALLDLWDSMCVVNIGSNATILSFYDVVSSFLWKDMRKQKMERHSTNALFLSGHS